MPDRGLRLGQVNAAALRATCWSRIDAGTIWLWGSRITGPGIDQNLVRRHVGIVFQSFNLFPHMTVLRNITLAPVKVLRDVPGPGGGGGPGAAGPVRPGRARRSDYPTGCPAASSSGSRSCARSP